jgi:hypothetical protein
VLPTIAQEAVMAEVYGADFSSARPDPHALRSSGHSFVVGYISRNPAKCLTDWRRYAAVGLGVAFVFEDLAVPDYRAGTADGQFCEQWLRAHGAPMNAPLFFAIDSDIPAADFPRVADYASHFNLATNSPVGPYGKYALVEALVTPGRQPMQLAWQASAWSGDRLSQKANLYQRHTHHHPVPGVTDGDFDEDVLIRPLAFAQVPTQVAGAAS